jgi:hydroxymethylglutaryl-CoA lyase
MSLDLPKKIEIIEVGPRDGLQNESTILKTDDKVEFIDRLILAGCKNLEVTSFVRKDKIPQMSDAEELFIKISDKLNENIKLLGLVPNIKGLESAINCGVREIAIFTSLSDTFNQKNINSTVKESLIKLEKVAKEAQKNNIKIRGYISTVFGCPYEGKSSSKKLLEVLTQLLSFGVYEISLGDTIGAANPNQVAEIINVLSDKVELSKIALHFHDTRGMALVNAFRAMQLGITKFDSSAGGIGGCPYAKGATGNLATEDLVYFANSLGVNTGIDLQKLTNASSFILDKLEKKSQSKVFNAFRANPF